MRRVYLRDLGVTLGFSLRYFLVRLLLPAVYLGGLLIAGTSGYMLWEGWNFSDAFFMTVITISTVGFGEIQKLSSSGRIFTSMLILGGVVFYGLAINILIRNLIEESFATYLSQARIRREIMKLKDHFIICGGGRMAVAIAGELDRQQRQFVILDPSPDAEVFRRQRPHWLILQTDALQEESLLAAGIQHAAGLASVLPTDADNLFVVLSARRIAPDLLIETRIASESSRPKMLQAGANRVVSPYAAAGLQIARSLLNPEISGLLAAFAGTGGDALELRTHKLLAGDPLVGMSPALSRRSDPAALLVAVRSGGSLYFPPPEDHTFSPGDEILSLAALRAPD